MSLALGEDSPVISRYMIERAYLDNSLSDSVKNAYINRIVREYIAYSMLEYSESVNSDSSNMSWSDIEGQAQSRYLSILSAVGSMNRGHSDFNSVVQWDALTLSAMDALRHAAREADDDISDAFGDDWQRSIVDEKLWESYRSRIQLDGSRVMRDRPLTAQEIDGTIVDLSDQIREKYAKYVDDRAPHTSRYVDALCLAELDMMYETMSEVGRTVDSLYIPSALAVEASSRTVMNGVSPEALAQQYARPDRYEVVAALQNGTFDDMADRLEVLPAGEIDELLSESIDMYLSENAGNSEQALEEATDMMDFAERSMDRHIEWRDSDAMERLRQEQELRDQAIAATGPDAATVEAVPLGETGLPDLSQADDTAEPDTVDEVQSIRANNRALSAQEKDALDQMSSDGVITADEVDRVEDMLRESRERESRRILEEAEEQERQAAEEQEHEAAQIESASQRVMGDLIQGEVVREKKKEKQPDFDY